MYIAGRKRGYAREIARFFATSLSPVQNALDDLEAAGILFSRKVGVTQEYEFNPRYPALVELKALVNRAIELYPSSLKQQLLEVRARPRRKGKPL